MGPLAAKNKRQIAHHPEWAKVPCLQRGISLRYAPHCAWDDETRGMAKSYPDRAKK